MKQKTEYCVEVNFKSGPPLIEIVSVTDAAAAHHVIHRKYAGQYIASTILGETPQTKLVYIASPYAGDTVANTQFAVQCCRYAVMRGYTPVAPHLLYPQMLDDSIPEERALGLALGENLLTACDEMWVCGERISDGMAGEIAHAKQQGICIRYVPELYGRIKEAQ